MAISEAQSRLLSRMIEIMSTNSADRTARWGLAAEEARKYAQENYLLLGRQWLFDYVLADNGNVFVVPTENPGPARPASQIEILSGLFPAIRVYPELLSFLPQRPEDSLVCHSCLGTGVVGDVRHCDSPPVHHLCLCGGAGWLPKDFESQLPIGESW